MWLSGPQFPLLGNECVGIAGSDIKSQKPMLCENVDSGIPVHPLKKKNLKREKTETPN